jgi:hypothetical protein
MVDATGCIMLKDRYLERDIKYLNEISNMSCCHQHLYYYITDTYISLVYYTYVMHHATLMISIVLAMLASLAPASSSTASP